MKIKKIIIILICMLITTSCNLTNTTNKDEVKEYKIKGVKVKDLEINNMYVKNKEIYYKAAYGDTTFDDVVEYPNSIRKMMFKEDDALIPTLFKDDELILYTNNNVPEYYIFERFEDEGYSIGLFNLKLTETGRCVFKKDENYIKYNSDFDYKIKDITTNEESILIIDKINDIDVTKDILSIGGTLTGFIYGQTYKVNMYIGSLDVSKEIIADTHMFTSFETYKISNYKFNKNNYIVFNLDNLSSGYYLVQNIGFIRYVNSERGTDISKINLNEVATSTATPIP